jgi:hypothetical protein
MTMFQFEFIKLQLSSLAFASEVHAPIIKKIVQETVTALLRPLTKQATAKYSSDEDRLRIANDIYFYLAQMSYDALQVMNKDMFIKAFSGPMEIIFGIVQCKLLDGVSSPELVASRRLLNSKIEEALKFCSGC